MADNKPTLRYLFQVNGITRVIHARSQKEANKRAYGLWGYDAFPIFDFTTEGTKTKRNKTDESQAIQ